MVTKEKSNDTDPIIFLHNDLVTPVVTTSAKIIAKKVF